MDEDPGWSWPAWKFGMKREDLFTKLHDQYNTVTSSIQDREAFHHDVFEISHQAASADEFHRLMASRKEYRLRELNDSLESAAVQIIANPSLIGTAQWQFALQLFRTMSLDSLVRYFSSYLPDDHAWHPSNQPTAESEAAAATAAATAASSLEPSILDEEQRLTHEPFSITSRLSQLPPSPRSMTTASDSAASSTDLAQHSYDLDTLTPARSLSFSGSETEHFDLKDSCPHLHEDDTSQSSDAETPVSSVSDLSETHQAELLAITADLRDPVVVAYSDECSSSRLGVDAMPSETPTPKPNPSMSCFFEPKISPHHSMSLRRRSISPSQAAGVDSRRSRRSPRMRHRDPSPHGRGRRRSPGEPASRIEKSLPDPIRSRPRGRRRVDC